MTKRRSTKSQSPRQRDIQPEALERRQLLSVSLISMNAGATGPGNASSGSIADVGPINPAISADGRYVAFVSDASDLVAGDVNATADVFLRDRVTGVTSLVSTSRDGGSGNARSGFSKTGLPDGVAISADGRYVAFVSEASDLVSGDENGAADVFVRDMVTGTITLVSRAAGGSGSATVGAGAAGSGTPRTSSDGRFVAFVSTATDLVADQDADGNQPDVFVRDLQTGTTLEVSKPADGQTSTTPAGSPSISNDGRYVAFTSADTLVAGTSANSFRQVYVYDTTTDQLVLASPASSSSTPSTGDATAPAISGDGLSVAFLSDANDLVAGFTDGNGDAASFADVFVRNLVSNTTSLVSGAGGSATAGGNGASFAPAISSDGHVVAFKSEASNLSGSVSDTNVATDVFVRDLTAATTTVASVASTGQTTGNAASGFSGTASDQPPGLSSDGRFVLFTSQATDLVSADTTALDDLYVRDLQTGVTRWLSTNAANNALGATSNAVISADGTIAAFVSDQFNLVPTDANNAADVFAAVVADGTTGGGGDNSGLIDLTVAVEGTLPATAVGGQKVKASPRILVTNGGKAVGNGTVTVSLYVSTDEQFDTGDVAAGSFTSKLKLKGGQTKTFKPKFSTFPIVSEGDYFLLAIVDSNGTIPETTTGNNAGTSAEKVHIAVPAVDLSAAFGSTPTAVTRGKRATIPLSITSGGNILAAGTVNISLIAVPTSPTTAAPIATIPVKIKLKPGATKKLKLKVLIPDTVPTGTYTFGATLAVVNPLSDANPANDSAAGTIVFTVS